MPLPNRVRGNKRSKSKFLIVCEGVSTEKKYFIGLKRHLMLPSMNIEPIGAGKSKQELVQHAIGARKRLKDVIATWVVFDKDSISNQDVEQTIKFAKDNNINVAFSNASFELWLVMHFSEVKHDCPLDQKRLYKLIESHCKYTDYKNKGKSDAFLLEDIAGEYETALKNSDTLYSEQGNIHQNPYCNLNKLVQELKGI
ncbi:RloB family protein [Bacillus velezensis]|uniref:RloB family protein n=1 Tax=Bacillus subtilis group TaxID=653685 RepID=UPI001EF13427|nr:RloB family protein [Bacillus velezensis]MEC3666970.1 RloB family protein [Bacillus velezensis]ULH21288.1 RloB family protein [Bacillus velezensis]UUT26326.1 RloB family protein [Bacillus velezensis]